MSKKNKKPNYEELGRMIEQVYETAYVSRMRMIQMSFLKGLAYGAGGVVGATILISLAVWILSLLSVGPLEPFVQGIQDSIEQGQTP